MERVGFVAETLRHVLPKDCDVIGEAAVEEIAAGPVEIVRAEHGSNLDLTETLVQVAAAAVVVRQAIEIYEKLWKVHARRITARELEDACEAEPDEPVRASVPPELRRKIYRYLEEQGDLGALPLRGRR